MGDSLKLGVSIAPATLTFFGVGLQDWVYITSALVAVMVMIEKAPIVINRVKTLYRWIVR
jgi:hypothetical protein